jgi:competence ComEA-like helix-hairpin-helix protein
MKEFIKGYFNFSRRERNAAIVLLILIALVFSVPYWYKPKPVVISQEMKDWLLETESKLEKKDSGAITTYNTNNDEKKISLFFFNPNDLDADGFARLGISAKTINTILNYRNKGGKFYKPDDFRKIYGLSKQKADELIPFIQLDSKQSTYNKANNNSAKSIIKKIEINTATAKDWEALPGIGKAFAERILSFREKLGGFYSIQQIKEVYGLKEETFTAIESYLYIKNENIHTININTATEEVLATHPYINAMLAKNIIIYRTKNKTIQQVKELLVMNVIKEEVYQKLVAYLTVK